MIAIACSASAPGGATPSAAAEQAVERSPAEPGVAPAEQTDPHHIAWGSKVAWRTWEQAQAAAAAEHRPICVVVYADWCERCKELAPLFSRNDVVALTRDLIMVKQNNDERPAWLEEKFGRFGQYVPRVFFVDPDGEVRQDVQSGHPRYPYFYNPLVADTLKANMRAVRGG